MEFVVSINNQDYSAPLKVSQLLEGFSQTFLDAIVAYYELGSGTLCALGR